MASFYTSAFQYKVKDNILKLVFLYSNYLISLYMELYVLTMDGYKINVHIKLGFWGSIHTWEEGYYLNINVKKLISYYIMNLTVEIYILSF